MIVCKNCGSHNPDTASFCSACGSFLEWTGERVEESDRPPRPEEPTTSETPSGPSPTARPSEPAATRGVPDRAPEQPPTVGPAPGAPPRPAPAPVVVSQPQTTRSGPGGGVAGPGEPPGTGGTVEEVSAAPQPTVSAPKSQPAERVSTPQEPPGPPHPSEGEAIASAAVTGAPDTGAAAPEAEEPEVAEPQPREVRPAARSAPATEAPERGQVAEPAGEQPGLVKPAAVQPRRPARDVEPNEEAPRPGEVICPRCGRGNDPTRRFCRRCGASLEAAAVVTVTRLPWWRRLFSRRRGPVAAGTRPTSLQRRAADQAAGHRGAGSRLLVAIAIVAAGLLVAGVLGYLVLPSVRDAVNGLVDQLRTSVAPSYVEVRPSGRAPAGPSLPEHPAEMAFDGDLSTSWVAPGDPFLVAITAYFEPPVDVAKVLITSGDRQFPRPRRIQIDFMSEQGGQPTFTDYYDLEDTSTAQILDVDAVGAAVCRITVLSVYGTGDSGAAIKEVEFRARR